MDLTRSDGDHPVWLCTDWAALWRDLVEREDWGARRGDDPWADRAEGFNQRLTRRWSRPHPLRDAVAARILPGSTVLDIGAGTGAWAILLAGTASRVTAVDPSPAMRAVMAENLAAAGVGNVDVVPGHWPDLDLPAHDYTLCSHAMYGSPDLPRFVQRMIEATHRSCFLLIRTPVPGGIMTEAARRLWGHPMDSPNFVIAYNVLLQMGLAPNVLISHQPWPARTSETTDHALGQIKEHFRLEGTEHDDYLNGLLRRRLIPGEGGYSWPPDLRSALIYWDVG